MTESPVPESTQRFLAPWQYRTALRLVALATAGYGYVSLVLCGRPPLASAPDGSWEFLKLILTTLILAPLLDGWITRPWTRSARDLRWGLIGFFLALHFQWIPRYAHIDFTLDPSLFSGGTAAPAWGALILAASGLGFAVGRHILEAHRSRHLGIYLALLVAVIAIPALITFMLRASHLLHLHHYAIGMMLMLLARHRFPLSGAVFGLAFGLLVEGIARWGMDPCWIAR